LSAAKQLGIPPERCVVFEDAEAGIQAAKAAGMQAIGIGNPKQLSLADEVFSDFTAIDQSYMTQYIINR